MNGAIFVCVRACVHVCVRVCVHVCVFCDCGSDLLSYSLFCSGEMSRKFMVHYEVST